MNDISATQVLPAMNDICNIYYHVHEEISALILKNVGFLSISSDSKLIDKKELMIQRR